MKFKSIIISTIFSMVLVSSVFSKTIIRFDSWMWGESDFKAPVQKVVDEYMKLNPNRTLQYHLMKSCTDQYYCVRKARHKYTSTWRNQ